MPPCDEATGKKEHDAELGFNPCFSGCRPATERILHISEQTENVSILVLVDAALRRFLGVFPVHFLGFQSLF